MASLPNGGPTGGPTQLSAYLFQQFDSARKVAEYHKDIRMPIQASGAENIFDVHGSILVSDDVFLRCHQMVSALDCVLDTVWRARK